RLAVRFLRLPGEPPTPFGDEESLLVFRAAPNFYKYRVFVWIVSHAILTLFFLFGAIGIVGGGLASGNEVLIAGAVVLGLLVLAFGAVSLGVSFALLRLDYEMRWYKVTDRSIRIREGVWI